MYQGAKRIILCVLIPAAGLMASAADIRVDSMKVTSAYHMAKPLLTDSTDVWGKTFNHEDMMMLSPISLDAWRQGEWLTDSIIPASAQGGVRLIGFQLDNTMFVKYRLKIESTAKFKTYVDGKE